VIPIVDAAHTNHETELRHHYDDELEEIRANLVDFGTMVLTNVRHSGEVVSENLLDEVAQVRAADGPINTRYSELEAKVFEILALQQPVARDLRFLVASTRVLYELERSGDLAVNLVKTLARLDGLPSDPAIQSLLTRLSTSSAKMFARGVEALASMDPQIGIDADELDQETDKLTRDLYRSVTERQEDLGLETAVALFRMGRFFERIADHGVNIAENVTFVVTAKFPDEG
jgi:phosphate transport system protein